MSDDLYDILGIPPDADDREVRTAYRNLAKKYHPDTGEGSSDEKFRAVQLAYDVLGDPQQRAAYDRDRKYRQRPQELNVVTRYSSRAAHVDLRHLSRRNPVERIDLRQGAEDPRAEANPWEDIFAFLFGDLY